MAKRVRNETGARRRGGARPAGDGDSSEGGARLRLSLDGLPPEQKRALLENFARGLEEALGSEGELGKKSLVEPLQAAASLPKSVDPRQFDNLLKELSKEGYLRFCYPLDPEKAQKLSGKQGLKGVGMVVVAGQDRDYFANAAAQDFIQQIYDVDQAKQKKYGKPCTLNVGIVSGSTTGAVVRAAYNMNWAKLGVDVKAIPRMRVFALNVCLTGPQHLTGNANILAYLLAEKVNALVGVPDYAQAYGLSAPLLVDVAKLQETDEAPQTYEVVQYTEPYRVRGKLAKEKADQEGRIDEQLDLDDRDFTCLDIVLSGVGEVPTPWAREEAGDNAARGQKASDKTAGGSIFYNIAKGFGFRMEEFIAKERVVGDLAFGALKSDGTTVALLGEYRGESRTKTEGADAGGSTGTPADGAGTEGSQARMREGMKFIFYSAVQLAVLKKMAEDPSKRVLLVARHDETKDKLPAIFASVAGAHRYVSRLVIDEQTAQRLIRY